MDSATAVRARLQALIQNNLTASNGQLPTERVICLSMGVSRRAVRALKLPAPTRRRNE